VENNNDLFISVKRGMISIIIFFKRDKFAMIGAIIYLFFILVAVFGPLFAPYDPLVMIKENGKLMFNQAPSLKHLLGTTNMGRDIFSQLIFGSRPALIVGFTAAFFVMVVGTLVGLFAGYYRGRLGSILMRLTDVAFGIPFIPNAISKEKEPVGIASTSTDLTSFRFIIAPSPNFCFISSIVS